MHHSDPCEWHCPRSPQWLQLPALACTFERVCGTAREARGAPSSEAERVAEAALLDLETAAGMIGGAATLCAMCSTIAGPVSGKVATAGRTKQETTRATTEAVTGRDATRGN